MAVQLRLNVATTSAEVLAQVNAIVTQVEKQARSINLKVNTEGLKETSAIAQTATTSMNGLAASTQNLAKTVSYFNENEDTAYKKVTTFNEGIGQTTTKTEVLNKTTGQYSTTLQTVTADYDKMQVIATQSAQRQVSAFTATQKAVNSFNNSLNGLTKGAYRNFIKGDLSTQLDRIVTRFNSIDKSAPDAARQISLLSSEMSTVATKTKLAAQAQREMQVGVQKTGDTIGKLISKVALWSVATTLIFAPVRAFKEALATMKEVDSELKYSLIY